MAVADLDTFGALRFDTAVAGDAAALIAPPYDVVSPEQAREARARGDFNIARVDYGESLPGDDQTENRYTRAQRLVGEWLLRGILVREPTRRMYLYEQRFTLHGQVRMRRAVFGRLRLEEWEKGMVLPHEHTGTAPKLDRLGLLRATRVHLSPIMVMGREILGLIDREAEALLDAVTAGERHTLRPLPDESAKAVRAQLAGQRVYVADGHHRYETALAYRDAAREQVARWRGDEPENFVLAAVVDLTDPDLIVLPTHRLLRLGERAGLVARVAPRFDVEDMGDSGSAAALERLVAALAEAGKAGTAFGAIGLVRSRLHLLRLRDRAAADAMMPSGHAPAWRGLDVNVLEHALYRDIGFEPTPEHLDYKEEAAEAARAVNAGAWDLAILLNPTTVAQVVACSDAGERLPRKSTFFYPKLATGMVMYPLD